VLAANPLNRTLVALERFVPVISTIVPAGPVAGVKPATTGAGMTVKVVVDAVPAMVVTAISPVVAPLGTWTVI